LPEFVATANTIDRFKTRIYDAGIARHWPVLVDPLRLRLR